MAGWLSNKLKVAESFLEQIDHQAAESLGKQENQQQNPAILGRKFEPSSSSSALLHHEKNAISSSAHKSGHVSKSKKNSHSLQLGKPILTVANAGTQKQKPAKAQNAASAVSGNDDWTQLLSSGELTSKKIDKGKSDSNYNVGSGESISSPARVNSKHEYSDPKRVQNASASQCAKTRASKKNANEERFNLQKASRKGLRDQPGKLQNIESVLSEAEAPRPLIDADVSVKPKKISYEKVEFKYDTNHGNISFQDVDGGSSSATLQKSPSLMTISDNDEHLLDFPSENNEDSFVDIGQLENLQIPQIGDHSSIRREDTSGTKSELTGSLSVEDTNVSTSNDISDRASRIMAENMVKDASENHIPVIQDSSVLQVDSAKRKFRKTERGVEFDSPIADNKMESDEGSEADSYSSSASGSDSDDEIERLELLEKRAREHQLAVEAASIEAAKAVIKEREEFVNKLEIKKQSLEEMLVALEEQQAKEAIKLEMGMKEVSQAADIEKENHYTTRMEALARIYNLEVENADLAKSLARVQRSLDLEVSRLMEIRSSIESREVALGEFERRRIQLHRLLSSSEQETNFKEYEAEEESLREEVFRISQKIEKLQTKIRETEEQIERTNEAWDAPTDIEVELERRLSQLTDYLLQKQAQVESLSAEKAILQLKMEALSEEMPFEQSESEAKFLKGNKYIVGALHMQNDLETGLIGSLGRDKGVLQCREFGSHSMLYIFRQLDTIFSTGAYYLRRNNSAQWFAFAYLFALHIWVLFILFFNSGESTVKSGAIYSLDHQQ